MKKLTSFETAIIGFFIGVIVAAYLAFLSTMNGIVGTILDAISLRSLYDLLNAPAQYDLVPSFLFTVAVFTAYGAVVGAIGGQISKSRYVAVPLTILGLAVVGQQLAFMNTVATSADNTYYQAAAVARSLAPAAPLAPVASPTEARGDMNADGLEDFASLVRTGDIEHGLFYSVKVALSGKATSTETNELSLGTILPRAVSIDKGILTVEYAATSSTSAPLYLYAHIEKGMLVKNTVATTTATTTVR